MPPMPLGVGPPDNDFTRVLLVVVEDIYGSATEMTTSVRVSNCSDTKMDSSLLLKNLIV